MAITYVVLGALPQSLTPQGQGQGEAAAEQGRVEEGREKERNGGSLVSHYAALSLSLSPRGKKKENVYKMFVHVAKIGSIEAALR